MTKKELFYLAGNCLSLDEHPEFRNEIIKKCQADRIDWISFVGLCSNHLILPVLFLKFRSHGILKYLPEELSEHLNDIYELNLSRNIKIQKQLQKITGTLNASKIHPTFLKGSGNLLDGLYSDVGERILGDIDFLVPEDQYLHAAKLMENDGYSTVTAIPDYTDVKSIKHYPRMVHPDYPAVIEIHRLPVREKLLNELNATNINAEKQPVANLPGCFVLSDQHKIILNFVHSQFGNNESAYSSVSLRDLYDLYLLSKRVPLHKIINHVRNTRSARNYFAFANQALNLSEDFSPNKSLGFRIFKKKQDLLLDSILFYRVYRTGYFLVQRIFSGYLYQFIQLFYSKKMRQSVIRRLGSRSWYANHLQLYARFLQRSK